MKLDATHLDRAAGVLLGMAAGDALGAGYEFTTPGPDTPIAMSGGGAFGWEPGEWTDDTQMALCIAQVTATGTVDLRAIGRRFLDWYAADPKDVGVQTSAVLSAAAGDPERLTAAAAEHFARHPNGAAGNGSLMRTAPVALACLGDDGALIDVAMATSALTHGDPLAGEACALWCVAIDRAVREGRLDGIDDGVALLPADRRDYWQARIAEARTQAASSFNPNGFVVAALQAALAAITQTPVPDAAPWRHLPDALEAAVRVGHDTDTVAAIAGALLGAYRGASALPFDWRRKLHGWPGHAARDLTRLAVLTARRGEPDSAGWPAVDDLAAHYAQIEPAPATVAALDEDPGVLVGNVHAVAGQDVDAVVSLCRMGAEQVDDPVEHLELPLSDQPGRNAHLPHLLLDTARGIDTLRREGKRVLVHCVDGRSGTPAVAACYLTLRFGYSGAEALRRVGWALDHRPNDGELIRFVESLPARSAGFAEAVAYAADAHAAHPRKGTTVPYLSHLLAVAALVMEDGGSDDEASAAVLHDAVEDQGGKRRLDDIRDRFGDRVADLVDACTDYDVDGDRADWRPRKRAYIDHIGQMPAAARRISLADKLHNARCILRDYRKVGEELWARFDPDSDQLWYYRALTEAFTKHADGPLVTELQATVAELERLRNADA